MIRWKALFRDTLVIFILTGLVGFVLAYAAKGTPVPMDAIALGNIIFMTVGFTISGGMAKDDRFQHLSGVAISVWLFSLVNLFIAPVRFTDWLWGVIPVIIAMVVGGLLSFLFSRPTPIEEKVSMNAKELNEDLID